MLRTLSRKVHHRMRDIVAVIGTTGVGKSQLAVSLGQAQGHDRALILSADSMQLYQGLDVITNKVTEEEKGGVEHWGLDIVEPGKGMSWEVGKWCGEADQVVSCCWQGNEAELVKIAELDEGRLPILCGGTHYFIQHFLFPPSNLAFSTDRHGQSQSQATPSNLRWTPPCPLPAMNLPPDYLKLLETFWESSPTWPTSTSEKTSTSIQGSSRPTIQNADHLLAQWKLLEMIDCDEAQRWHWRDGRKVKRGIERWWERQAGVAPLPCSAAPSVKPR